MRRITGFFLIAAGLLVAALIVNKTQMFSLPVPGFPFAMKEVNEEQTFEAGGFRELTVDAGSMDLNVARGNTDRIKVRLQGKANSGIADKMKFKAEPDGGKLVVQVESQDNFDIGFRIRDVNLTVELPDKLWSAIEIKSGSGNVDLQELNGDSVRVEVGSGDVRVRHAKAGDFQVKSDSGNLNITDIEGDAIGLDLGSGDITIDRFKAVELKFQTESGNVMLNSGDAAVKGNTNSGDIRIDAVEWANDAELESGSGNVTVDLEREPTSLAVEYRGGSGVGHVRWQGISYEVSDEDHNRIKGTFGSGKYKLDVRTDSGDFKLE